MATSDASLREKIRAVHLAFLLWAAHFVMVFALGPSCGVPFIRVGWCRPGDPLLRSFPSAQLWATAISPASRLAADAYVGWHMVKQIVESAFRGCAATSWVQ